MFNLHSVKRVMTLYVNMADLSKLYLPVIQTFRMHSLRLLAVKLGIASAAVYYINEQGVWKSSNESVKTLGKMKKTVNPYIQQVKAQIPIELPELPESGQLSALAREGWNKGVLATFRFLSDLPQTANEWTAKGVNIIKQNPDIQNFMDSFSSKTETK